jgi:hypothetical protein
MAGEGLANIQTIHSDSVLIPCGRAGITDIIPRRGVGGNSGGIYNLLSFIGDLHVLQDVG